VDSKRNSMPSNLHDFAQSLPENGKIT